MKYELTKEQKIAVIDEILAKYKSDESYQWYIRNDVTDAAYIKGYTDGGKDAVELIPELLDVNPEGADMRDAWFGNTYDPINRPLRLAALRRLREIVMKSEK
ncbi:MAG: hypothetical protein LBF55_07575 [Prevotellaceae bacterium]|jgi:hypothetical protein|nr:hypothetical protein [Prevotellaceae bacterium]